ncbi:MAG: DUF998 domain-containing protein [Candidatus Hermodarchaeota archaeon]
MTTKSTFFKKWMKSIPASVFGLLSFGISLITHLIAVLLYPNYDITSEAISLLSNGNGGILYRIGLILSGILGIPFCIYMGKFFKKDNSIELIRKLALIGSIIYCISLIFIGYFWGDNLVISTIHGISAVLCWIDGFVFISLFSILMFKDRRFPVLCRLIGVLTAGAFLLHLIVLSPITQWIMTLSIMLWVWINSSYMLYKHY